MTYNIGDTLDVTGLVLTETFSDNSTATTSITNADVSGFNSSVTNPNEILTITVGTATTSYAIAINPASSGPVSVTGVSVNPTSLNLTVGNTGTLTETIAPANATNQNVNWDSDDTSVATVANGVVTAVATGTTDITVTTADGNFTATSTVTVTAVGATIPVTGVTLDQSSMTLTAGNSGTLHATVNPNNATNQNISWTSDNTGVATVVGGVVTAVSAGTANITVTTTDGNFTAVSSITVNSSGPVNVPVTGVTLDQPTMTLAVGDSGTLIQTIAPANATNQNVTWNSDNTAVATVVNGVVTAVATGTANITVTTADGGKTATSIVTVSGTSSGTVAVTGVSLDQPSMTLVAGNSGTLHATIAPADATNQNISWSSDNTAVATVNSGIVTAVASGTANITVTTADGNFTAVSAVTVTPAIVSINSSYRSYC